MSAKIEIEHFKLYTADNSELVSIDTIKRDKNVLLVKGKIMGAMPMKAQLRPEEVRKAIKLLNFRTILFILSLPFRRGK